MQYYQPVDINVLWAQDLNSVNSFIRPKLYVSVSVTSGSRDQQVTPSAVYCNKKLFRWNYRMRFHIEDDKIQKNESMFVFQIKSKRFLRSEQVVGKLFVPVKGLKLRQYTDMKFAMITESGKPNGYLCLEFRFGDIYKGKIRDDSDNNYNIRVFEFQPSAPCEDDFFSLK